LQLLHPITVHPIRYVATKVSSGPWRFAPISRGFQLLSRCHSRCYTPTMFALRALQKRSSALLVLSSLCLIPACPAFPQTVDASVVDLDGHPADPFRLAGSKIVVLLFIRTDCPISNRYAPTIQELSVHYAGHAAFFLIYPIKSETPRQIRKHLQDYGYHLAAFRDPSLTLARASQVRITPEVAVFSPARKLLYHGRIDDWYVEFTRARYAPTTHDLVDALDAAVSGKPVASASTPAVGCYIPGLP
jgi:thiol-disulfide isomerase/thioredoxin